MDDLNDLIHSKLRRIEELGLKRELRLTQGLVDFSSNDYLGVNRNPEVQKRILEAIHKYKPESGSTGSRLLTGNSQLAYDLEEQLADFHKAESALLFNSGYNANVGLLTALGQKEVTIIYDELVHASIHDGIRLSKASSVPFVHNDMNDLELKLKDSSGVVLVVVESLYSMDGDLAPLIHISKLCNSHGASLVVDEAHAVGMYGEKGEGRVVELGLEDEIPVRLVTFGKAVGCHGAAVLCSSSIRDFLINNSRSLIFTTALPDHSLLPVKTAYDMMSVGGIKNLNTSLLISLFKQLMSGVSGFDASGSDSHIQAVILPGNDAVQAASAKLKEAGLDVRPIRFPSVPKGKERLRICLHEFNTEDEVKELCKALRSIL